MDYDRNLVFCKLDVEFNPIFFLHRLLKGRHCILRVEGRIVVKAPVGYVLFFKCFQPVFPADFRHHTAVKQGKK